jgi:lipoteichoic acid synthase
MVIPTSAARWSQDAMCKAYGVERLYSVNEYHGPHEPCLSDDQVVALADSVDGLSREPFFSMVLTFSTHMPYDKTVDPTFKATSQVQPEDYANYLNACHFMDRNLQRYVESLKRHGLYDNSLILIVSDHHVQEQFLTLPGVKQRELPVFIIHGGIDRQNAWTGPCHQLDVFTTLLDLLGIRPAWAGLGHTLINPHYENSLPEGSPKWDYSDWMIQSDWFKR